MNFDENNNYHTTAKEELFWGGVVIVGIAFLTWMLCIV